KSSSRSAPTGPMSSSVRGWEALPRRFLELHGRLLDLGHTLDCGQCFRWRRDEDGWVGVLGRNVVRLERLDDRRLAYQSFPDEALDDLSTFLRLDVDLEAVHGFLRSRDPRMDEATDGFAGLRVLGQPPRETLLTFVCSPASNVTRITRSIDVLARLYADPIATIGKTTWHAFPSAEVIAATEPGELMRTAGLGFRGENLRRIAFELLGKPDDWPAALIGADLEDARRALIALPSIGPKIADCVALFGLRHDAAVPVDTHVW